MEFTNPARVSFFVETPLSAAIVGHASVRDIWNFTCSAKSCCRVVASKKYAAKHKFDRKALMFIRTIQQAKRWVKILFGFTLLALGIVMIVTPGPGWLTILLGLGILAAEFVWARTLLDRLKEQGIRLRDAVFVRQPADRV
jgi:uncharacterized protein (TIGR02611 family)